MTLQEAEKLVKKCSQEHVLAHWNKLGKKERDALLEQIATLDAKSLERC